MIKCGPKLRFFLTLALLLGPMCYLYFRVIALVLDPPGGLLSWLGMMALLFTVAVTLGCAIVLYSLIPWPRQRP